MHVYTRWARATRVAFAVCATLVLGMMPAQAATAAPDPGAGASTPPATDTGANYTPADCGAPPQPGFARCFALIHTDTHQQVVANAAAPPAGALGPADIQDAYRLPADRGDGQVVAIVDAFGYSGAEQDLSVFRSFYGLPPCTTENGCFTKVDQDGGTDYPPDDGGWALETALDLDAVSSACPKCHILLVEGNSSGLDDLGIAVDTAVRLGARYVSNSYGVPGEFADETSYDHYYDHPGVAVTASTGDTGNVVNWPASSPNVVAIAGTALRPDTSNPRGWHETAWTGAGSGCSPYEAKPNYQQSVATNCDTRAIGDISAVADPNTGLGVYDTLGRDGWLQVGGTSLSSPLVAAMYALAGPPTPGTYPVTYPYDPSRAGDLFDVTEGRNSGCGTVLCTAGPGWDGPTGLGTPNGVAALNSGPHGDITGTVTDAATGAPIVGATVSTPEGYQATTDASGAYDLSLEVGSYDVSAQMFGYDRQTRTGVTVTEDQTVDVDFALTLQPNATVDGVVSDGSGQGWPLYARITIDGYPGGAIYTDPFTGHYSVTLPRNASYTLHVAGADLPGYQSRDVRVDVGGGDQTANVELAVDPVTCVVPGYHLQYDGATQRFTGWTGANAQDGWTISTTTAPSWQFDNPSDRPAPPTSDGDMAVVEGSGALQDASLVTPPVDLSGVTTPVLAFDTSINPLNSNSDVDLSLDGGATWSTVWSRGPTLDESLHGHVRIPVPQAAGKANVQIRFHYVAQSTFYWAVDNVFVGPQPACVPTSGGVVTGLVDDDNTGAGVNDVRVRSDDQAGESGVTRATPDDPNLPDGYYWMFSSLIGEHAFTASRGHYASATATARVTAGTSVRQDFTLRAGHLTVTPGSITQTERMGDKPQHQTVTFGNDGTEPVHVTLSEQRGGFTPMAGFLPAGTGAPLRLVKGNFSPKLPEQWFGATGHAEVAQDTTPSAGPWTDIADLPEQVMDNVVGHDNGKVYSVGGWDGSSRMSAGYVYDPATKAWSRIADLPEPLESAAGTFANGRMYVLGGATNGAQFVNDVFAYDPASDTWAKLASMPRSLTAPSVAVLGGQIYVVGGCPDFFCSAKSASVYRYDPASDTWTTVADYPEPMVWGACAGVPAGIVCAGGLSSAGQGLTSTYRYDASRDRWTRVADLPYDNWAMAYSAANGKLQVMSGVSQSALTNQAAEYDPATDAWSLLPNVNQAMWRGRGTCGMYKIGGGTNPNPSLGLLRSGEMLPGYEQCNDAGPDLPWLAESTTGFDVRPGQKVTVRVTVGNAALGQPGDYTAGLGVTADTPYLVHPVGVSLHLDPPRGWGKIRGTVTDADTGDPVAGAMVHIMTKHRKTTVSYVLQVDQNGYYQLWLDARYRLQVIYSKDGYVSQLRDVSLRRRATSTVDVALTTWSSP